MATRTFTEQETMLLNRVRATVYAIEPNAQIILYGSRARGDAEPEPDWDLLVLLDGPVTYERVDAVRHRLYELEWETGTVLGSVIRSTEEWDSPRYRAMPFHKSVLREGLQL